MQATRPWAIVFQDAIYEADPMIAEVKIRWAEAAIFSRIQGFSASANSAEEQALFNALVTIRLLRSLRQLSRAILQDVSYAELSSKLVLHRQLRHPNCADGFDNASKGLITGHHTLRTPGPQEASVWS